MNVLPSALQINLSAIGFFHNNSGLGKASKQNHAAERLHGWVNKPETTLFVEVWTLFSYILVLKKEVEMICKECGNETCGTGIPERDMPICGWCYGDLVGAPRIGDMSEGGNLSVWLDDCPTTELLKKVGF